MNWEISKNKKDGPCYADLPGAHANRWKGAPQARNKIYPSIFIIMKYSFLSNNFCWENIMPNGSETIVQKPWNYCNVLCDDGMSYGDYVE